MTGLGAREEDVDVVVEAVVEEEIGPVGLEGGVGFGASLSFSSALGNVTVTARTEADVAEGLLEVLGVVLVSLSGFGARTGAATGVTTRGYFRGRPLGRFDGVATSAADFEGTDLEDSGLSRATGVEVIEEDERVRVGFGLEVRRARTDAVLTGIDAGSLVEFERVRAAGGRASLATERVVRVEITGECGLESLGVSGVSER